MLYEKNTLLGNLVAICFTFFVYFTVGNEMTSSNIFWMFAFLVLYLLRNVIMNYFGYTERPSNSD